MTNRTAGHNSAAACKCDCPLHKSGYEMRKALLCSREGTSSDKTKRPEIGVDFEKKACIDGTCHECGDMKLLPMCAAEKAVLRPITFMSKEQVQYMTNKGEVKFKQDYVKRTKPIGEFLGHMAKVFLPFVGHHASMKWQAWDWAYCKANFPRGTWLCVQDFSENLKLEVKLEVR